MCQNQLNLFLFKFLVKNLVLLIKNKLLIVLSKINLVKKNFVHNLVKKDFWSEKIYGQFFFVKIRTGQKYCWPILVLVKNSFGEKRNLVIIFGTNI